MKCGCYFEKSSVILNIYSQLLPLAIAVFSLMVWYYKLVPTHKYLGDIFGGLHMLLQLLFISFDQLL